MAIIGRDPPATERRVALLDHGGQSLGQAVPADRVEAAQHGAPGGVAFALDDAARVARGSWSRAVRRRSSPGASSPSLPDPLVGRRGHVPRRAGVPASRAPHGRPGPARAARRRRARGRRAGDGSPPACRATPRDPPPVACRAPCRVARRAGGGARRRRGRPWWTPGDSVGPRSGMPGISSPRASSPASNFGEARRLEPADTRSWSTIGSRASSHSGWTSTSTRRSCVGRAVPDHDDGVVERDLRRVDTADPQHEGAPACPDLEHLVQPARADDGAQAAPHRTVRAERSQPRSRQDLGHLQTLAEPAPLGGPGVLQRHLVLPAATPCRSA